MKTLNLARATLLGATAAALLAATAGMAVADNARRRRPRPPSRASSRPA